MRQKLTAIGLIAVAGILVVGVSSGQDVRPVPGPGTGIVTVAGGPVTVTGTVDIGNAPIVNARQASDWKVVLAHTPDVRVAAPDFLRVGGRYQVSWLAGQSEDIVVTQVGSGGWTRVESSGGRRRWINLGEAREIEELGAGR
jgi:hypothetical protein